ncbi:MAG TPA: hypothetical protein DCG62_09205 [Acinetobacter johnsonii]|nr:hypothetical protein [Acinetobacter johnsonii]
MRLYIPIKSRVISIFQVLYFIFTGKSSKKSKALLYLIDKKAKYFLLILKKYDVSFVLGILSGFIYYAQALSLLD